MRLPQGGTMEAQGSVSREVILLPRLFIMHSFSEASALSCLFSPHS